MKEINELLKKNNIRYSSFRKKGSSIIFDNKFVVRKNKTNIYDYLSYRNFNNYPNLKIDDGYEIVEYIDEIDIPKEQKMIDLIEVISSLHKKTNYYKKITDNIVDNIYDEIKQNIEEIKNYYDQLMLEAESSVYMRPSYYLLARNISNIYKVIIDASNNLEKWYKDISELKSIRVSIIHNNLSLEHFINNKVISWDKSKISIPIYDLVKLYKNTYNEYDWVELINIYENNFLLREEEHILFDLLVSIPNKVDITNIEIDNVIKINEELNYIKLTNNFISNKNFKYTKNEE